MLASRWWALVLGATICTALWLLVEPDRRVYFTAGIGGVLYGMAFFLAPGVERLTDTGETIAAPIGPTLQYLLAVLALLSLAVVFLRRLGEWPPEQTPEARAQEQQQS